MYYKKAIGPVVAMSLLVVLSVGALVGFQSWFQQYQSGINSNVETKSSQSSSITKIENLIDGELYFKNGFNENLSVNSIKVGMNDCDYTGNFTPGMNSLVLGNNCTQNLSTSTPEVVVSTNKGVYTKKVFIGGNGNVVSELLNVTQNESFIVPFLFNLGWNSELITNTKSSNPWTGAYSVDYDSLGNTYIAGEISSTTGVDFGNNVKIELNDSKYYYFLLKIDSSGNAVWVKYVTRDNSEFYHINPIVVVDNLDNVYFSGELFNDHDFGNGISIIYEGDSFTDQAFLVKYDSSGNTLWGTSFLGDIDYLEDIEVDNLNNIYLGGIFQDTLDFGNNNYLYSQNSYDIFLVKYDSSGNYLWSKGAVDDSELVTLRDMVIDSSGNIFITGSFENYVDFGASQLTSPLVEAFYVSKYDSSGNNLMAFGISNDSYSNAISLDNLGNIYVLGKTTSSSLDFGNGVNISEITSDPFLVKYDSLGNAIWAKYFPASSSVDIIDLNYFNDEIYITLDGWVSSVDFGNGVIKPSAWFHDLIIGVLNTSGDARTYISEASGYTPSLIPLDTKIDSFGNIYSVGYYTGSVDFSSGISLENKETSSYYYIKFNNSFDAIVTSNIVQGYGEKNDLGSDLFVNSKDDVYVSGYTYSKFSFGNNEIIPENFSGFIVKYNSSNEDNLIAEFKDSFIIDFIFDSSNFLYVLGRSDNLSIYFPDGYNLINDDYYIAKFDELGNTIWAKSFTCWYCSNVRLKENNDYLYFYGGSERYARIDGIQAAEYFLYKLDLNGNVTNVIYGDENYDFSYQNFIADIGFDSNNNIYLFGDSTGILNFTNTIFSSTNTGYDPFIAKIDENLNLIWVKEMNVTGGNYDHDKAKKIYVNGSGDIYIYGTLESSVIDFGNDNFAYGNGNSLFFAKFDSNGNSIWANSINSSSSISADALTMDEIGNLYISGNTYSTTTYSNNLSSNSRGMFIVNYNAFDGKPYSLKFVSGSGYYNNFYDLYFYNDTLYATGKASENLNFGNTNLVNNGGSDFFLVKYQ